jgi:hypothetical protein
MGPVSMWRRSTGISLPVFGVQFWVSLPARGQNQAQIMAAQVRSGSLRSAQVCSGLLRANSGLLMSARVNVKEPV